MLSQARALAQAFPARSLGRPEQFVENDGAERCRGQHGPGAAAQSDVAEQRDTRPQALGNSGLGVEQDPDPAAGTAGTARPGVSRRESRRPLGSAVDNR